MSRYVTEFQFSFIEVERFRYEDKKLVLVQHKAPQGKAPPGVSVRDDWSWEKYQTDSKISADRIESGKRFADQLLSICSKQGWNVEMRFRKGYCPFQMPGAWNVFDLSLSGASGVGTA